MKTTEQILQEQNELFQLFQEELNNNNNNNNQTNQIQVNQQQVPQEQNELFQEELNNNNNNNQTNQIQVIFKKLSQKVVEEEELSPGAEENQEEKRKQLYEYNQQVYNLYHNSGLLFILNCKNKGKKVTEEEILLQLKIWLDEAQNLSFYNLSMIESLKKNLTNNGIYIKEIANAIETQLSLNEVEKLLNDDKKVIESGTTALVTYFTYTNAEYLKNLVSVTRAIEQAIEAKIAAIKQQQEEEAKIKQQEEEAKIKQQEEEAKIKQQEADRIKQEEELKELLKEKTFFDKGTKTKINSIIKNTTTLGKEHIKKLSNYEKILLLSKAPLEDTRYEALKKDKTIKFDNSPTSIKALLKKNDGSYQQAIKDLTKSELVKNNSFINRTLDIKSTDCKELETLKEDELLKTSIISKVSEPKKYSTIAEASKVAFSLLSDKQIAQGDKQDLTKTVKIISSLIGKSKDERKITASEILSNTVTINDRRLKLLGYVYNDKDSQYNEIGEEAKNILGKDKNITTLEEKKNFIEAVGYKFSFETAVMRNDQVEQDIKDLQKPGWKIDSQGQISFTKPTNYNDSKEILNSFINRSLNAIEVSKSATKASENKPDTNIKTKLGVHKIIGLKTNDQQNQA